MPKRMQEDAQKKDDKLKKVEELRKKMFEENCTFAPSINKEVPNHKQLQEEFQEQLKTKKESKQKTQPEEF
jgi:hypothetical protein